MTYHYIPLNFFDYNLLRCGYTNEIFKLVLLFLSSTKELCKKFKTIAKIHVVHPKRLGVDLHYRPFILELQMLKIAYYGCHIKIGY